MKSKITEIYFENSVTAKTKLPLSAKLVVLSSENLNSEEIKKIIEAGLNLGVHLEWAGNPDKEGENFRKKFHLSEIPEEFLKEYSSLEIKEILRERKLIPGKFIKEEQKRLLGKIVEIF
ncbi:MAG: hypothetical protein P1P85_02975 [Patescibacteria group bacterium]|nr:hypothetical protein [Patescibacteria group bacterium]